MPSDAALVLAAVKAAIVATDADTPVRTSKRPVTQEKQGLGGFQTGLPLPCYVLSCADREEPALGDFENIVLVYEVTAQWLKAAQARVAGAVDQGAPAVVEDDEVRAVREALRAALYKTLSVVPRAFHTGFKTLPVYESTPEGQPVVLVTGESFSFHLTEPRP